MTLSDGSVRHKLVGGPYDSLTVRVWGTDPITFPPIGSTPAAVYVFTDVTVGKGKRERTITTFVHLKEETT